MDPQSPQSCEVCFLSLGISLQCYSCPHGSSKKCEDKVDCSQDENSCLKLVSGGKNDKANKIEKFKYWEHSRRCRAAVIAILLSKENYESDVIWCTSDNVDQLTHSTRFKKFWAPYNIGLLGFKKSPITGPFYQISWLSSVDSLWSDTMKMVQLWSCDPRM